jgi:hypothetical protein
MKKFTPDLIEVYDDEESLIGIFTTTNSCSTNVLDNPLVCITQAFADAKKREDFLDENDLEEFDTFSVNDYAVRLLSLIGIEWVNTLKVVVG